VEFWPNLPISRNRILRENPARRELAAALRAESHAAESIHTLKMQGLDNGKLYRFALDNFEVCFTRDFGFINNIRQGPVPEKFKLLRVTLDKNRKTNS
jgi:hypothetical protein